MCPAVVMSLMYTVNSEISGEANLEFNYTINVMISGIGIILGPILSGKLDLKSKYQISQFFFFCYYVRTSSGRVKDKLLGCIQPGLKVLPVVYCVVFLNQNNAHQVRRREARAE